MKLPEDTDWLRRASLRAVIAALGAGESRVVGGAVRDTLLGLPVSDIDIATRLSPDAVIEALERRGIRSAPTGVAHGTVTALSEDGPVEITTLRRDVATDGRHARVEFTDDWREDAARRDFTINALSADPETGSVHDYHDGLRDLEAGRVRFIGDPLARIAEDHLRILRFFRFHARFGSGAPDSMGYAAARERARDLMTLSRERIASELLKLLASPSPMIAVNAMIEGGIFAPVLPELADGRRLARLIAREHEFGFAASPIRRLAALIDGEELASEIAARLRLSKAQSRRLTLAAGRRDQSARATCYRIGRESTIDQLLIGDGATEDFAALQEWTVPALPISGGALIARGLTPGPAIAKALRAIEAAWIAGGFPQGDAFDRIVEEVLRRA